MSVSDGVLLIKIENGNNAIWGVILNQSSLQLVKGQKYRLSFKAMAGQSTPEVQIFVRCEGTTLNSNEAIYLETRPKYTNLEFTVNDKADVIEFALGGANGNYSIYIDEVSIYQVK